MTSEPPPPPPLPEGTMVIPSHQPRRSETYRESSATLVNDGLHNSRVHSPHRQEETEEQIVVSWDINDKENPYNWSKWRKLSILIVGVLVVLNSTLGSSLPAGISSQLPTIFNIPEDNTAQLTLPISTYLLGYVVAPLAFGPISEQYGRRPLMIYAFWFYILFTMACALSPNFASLCVFRFLTGIAASAPIVVTGGLYADIYDDPVSRGRAMATMMASTSFGPSAIAPLISGFLGPINWKLPFWTAMAIAGATMPALLLIMPETYGPVLLQKRAQRLRKSNTGKNYVAPLELETGDWKDLATRVLTRPVKMFFTENMVMFTCIYCALVYAIFYLYFDAYPIIFQEMYGLSIQISSLAFLAIAAGSLLSFPIFLTYDIFLSRAQKRGAPWTKRYEARRLPLAFIGGPLISISIFWLSWTSISSISPLVPAISGILYGIGFVLIFMSLLNYLTDAYEIYAASALAATSTTRSIVGAVLPLAAGKMYKTLGIQWATSLLGFLSVACIAIPYGFWVWGERLREGSKFAGEVKRRREKEEERLKVRNASVASACATGPEGVDVEKDACPSTNIDTRPAGQKEREQRL